MDQIDLNQIYRKVYLPSRGRAEKGMITTGNKESVLAIL